MWESWRPAWSLRRIRLRSFDEASLALSRASLTSPRPLAKHDSSMSSLTYNKSIKIYGKIHSSIVFSFLFLTKNLFLKTYERLYFHRSCNTFNILSKKLSQVWTVKSIFHTRPFIFVKKPFQFWLYSCYQSYYNV